MKKLEIEMPQISALDYITTICDENGLTITRGIKSTNNYKLPKKYIINKKATILIWEDKSKTIVKKSEDDIYDKRLAFLTAYFQKNSGLSKNKANKYLKELVDEEDIVKEKNKKEVAKEDDINFWE